MMCRKLEMLPIECIVRGYITGSGWASYQKTGKVCGIELPEGLKESDKLPEPIYTPSTKAEIGDHDENISYEQSIAHLEKYFPGKGAEYAEKLRDYTIALYKKCADYAFKQRQHIFYTERWYNMQKLLLPYSAPFPGSIFTRWAMLLLIKRYFRHISPISAFVDGGVVGWGGLSDSLIAGSSMPHTFLF